jgi:hypothetical protein
VIEKGMKFKPRGRKTGHDTRFNERVLTVLDANTDARGRVLVESFNQKIGSKKRQRIYASRLESAEYQRLFPLVETPAPEAKQFSEVA